MTLLEQLQAHKGGLIQLKSQLYWYDGRGYDGTPGRICLLLDATHWRRDHPHGAAGSEEVCRGAAVNADVLRRAAEAAFLLIDGQPQWIWVAEEDIELLVNDPPKN